MKAIILVCLLLTACEHLDKIQVKGEITGNKYSHQPFVEGKHVMSATYPISETINIKGKMAQPYIGKHSIDTGMPDYGETSLEILF